MRARITRVFGEVKRSPLRRAGTAGDLGEPTARTLGRGLRQRIGGEEAGFEYLEIGQARRLHLPAAPADIDDDMIAESVLGAKA